MNNRHQRRKAKRLRDDDDLMPGGYEFWGGPPPTKGEFDEWLTNEGLPALEARLEAKGLFEKVRDADGNVVMEPDSKGVLQIVWRRVTAPEGAPSTLTEH